MEGSENPNEKDVCSSVEAVLFMSTEPLKIERIAGIIGIGSIGVVKKGIEQLKRKYDEMNSAVQVVDDNGLYSMQVRDEFLGIASKISKFTELSKGELKTLAYIAKKEDKTGVLQSSVVRTLGSNAYAHIHSLAEKGFIKGMKKGRTKLLNTTRKFREYFKVEKI